MKLVLTQDDLDAMPRELHEQLFDYLRAPSAGERHPAEAIPLTREQVIALLREVSFHRSGSRLLPLLDRLAYGEAAKPPSRDRLSQVLDEEGEHLGRYIATLNRMARKVTGRPQARLCERQADGDTYAVPAATRALLRELLTRLHQSPEHEEPLWE